MIELGVSFVLKFLHLCGLMMGAGAGLGSMAVSRRLRRAGPVPELLALRPFFARLALWGVALIWASGLGLWLIRYDFADLGPVYSLKLVVALVLLAVALALHRLGRRAAPPAWLPMLGMATAALTLLAVALSAWVFV